MADWISIEDRFPERSDSHDIWAPFKNNYTESELRMMEFNSGIRVLASDGKDLIGFYEFYKEDPEDLNRGPGFYSYDEYDIYYESDFGMYWKEAVIKYWLPIPKPYRPPEDPS